MLIEDTRIVTRRELLKLGACSLGWASAGALTACAPEAPYNVAIQPFCGYQFLSLASQEGLLRGTDARLVPASTYADAVAALVKNEADGAAVTLDQAIALRDGGLSLGVVMVFDISAGGDVVMARPGIDSIADLRNRRIGVETTSLGTIMLAKVLDAAGLRRSDVVAVPMGESHDAAWNRGGLDAVFTYEPSLGRLRKQGLASIFDSRSIPQTIVDVLAVRTDTARHHAHALKGLIAAHFRALRRWRNNPIDTAYRLSGFLGTDAHGVRDVVNGLDLPDVLYNRHYRTPPADELMRTARDLAAILLRERTIQKPPRVDGLFIPDYLPGEDT